eukprot:scaffold46265_cov47-Phaeocystis_antarctica.AAC.3
MSLGLATVDSQVASVPGAGVSVLVGYGDAAASAVCANPVCSGARELNDALRSGTRTFRPDRSIHGRPLGQPLEGQESQGGCWASVPNRRPRTRCARGGPEQRYASEPGAGWDDGGGRIRGAVRSRPHAD